MMVNSAHEGKRDLVISQSHTGTVSLAALFGTPATSAVAAAELTA
jgi:hypothetical protein